MVEKMETSHCWWFDSHKKSKQSPWLKSTLADLDSKTKGMLKLIEEDADSFAQRAEMYYKKRPELISMVEDFYRAHRSLAERYDQVKSDSGTRLLTSLGSPFSTPRRYHQQEENLDLMHKIVLDSCSETYGTDKEDAAHRSLTERYDQVKSDSGTRLLTSLGSPFSTPGKYHQQEENLDLMHKIVLDSCSKTYGTDQEDAAHRSLAERYDQVESDSGTRLLTSLGSPFSTPRKYENLDLMHKIVLDSCSETYDTDQEDAESEVEDPEEFKKTEISSEEKPFQKLTPEEDITSCDEVSGEDEVEKLKEESENQKILLMQKDEEKREVIRQLSLSIQILKEENLALKKSLPRSDASRRWNPFEASKFKGGFLGKLFNGAPRSLATVVL